jgi:predicted amidohydrolase
VSGVAKREMVTIELVSIEWATVDIGNGGVVVCYDLSVPFELSLILTLYI